MRYHTYIPQSPLSDFVDVLWHYEGADPPHARERLLPDGSVELVINLQQDTVEVYDRQNPGRLRNLRGASICGVYSEHVVIGTAGRSAMMGVHFKPGGAFPFFGLPACELRNTHVSLDDLWRSKADDLRDELLEAGPLQDKFHIVEKYLFGQAAQPLRRHPAVGHALKAFRSGSHRRSVADVMDEIGLSQRRFIQVFNEAVGLTPKLFWRVRRFQEVLRRIQKAEQVEWTRVALDCGYFDQAHFIHDFQSFSGLNPGTYLTQRSEHLNHVPLPG